MDEILNSFKQKSIPKFQQTLINFEKHQNFQNPQNLGFKTWNACKWRRLEASQVKENLKKLEESMAIQGTQVPMHNQLHTSKMHDSTVIMLM